MFNFKSILNIVALILVINVSGYSQKEAVILYNSQPVKVELSDQGKINSFIGLVPGYMAGFNLAPVTNAKLAVIDEPQAVKKEDANQNAGYAIVSSEKIELQYKSNFATLDKSIINKLNDIAAYMKLNPGLKILITAHSPNGKGSKLISNRLASAIAYLGIKGVNPDNIRTEVQQSNTSADILSIYYLS